MSAIKPIETRYKGYRFRSRLEARWAVFFDAIGADWQYEPEGFDIDGRWYLPDFRIESPAGWPLWVEVKPKGGATEDCPIARLGEDNYDEETKEVIIKADSIIVEGDPAWWIFESVKGREIPNWPCPRCLGWTFYSEPLLSDDVGLACEPCDFTTPCGGYHPDEMGHRVPYRTHKGWIMLSMPDAHAWNRLLIKAATKARAARFEHGERG